MSKTGHLSWSPVASSSTQVSVPKKILKLELDTSLALSKVSAT